jgi:hypothetical protein
MTCLLAFLFLMLTAQPAGAISYHQPAREDAALTADELSWQESRLNLRQHGNAMDTQSRNR